MIPLVVVLSGLSAGADARVAIAGDLVVTAAGHKVVVHSGFGEPRSFEIPCDARDLVARAGFGEAEWAVLCTDRIVWHHRDATSELGLDHANPTAFSVAFGFARVAVGYDDGTVALYALDAKSPPKIAHYPHRIVAVRAESNVDVSALTDEGPAIPPAHGATFVVATDAAGQVTAHFEAGTSPHAKRRVVEGRAVWLDGNLDVADVAATDDRICVTTAGSFTCFAPAAPKSDDVDVVAPKLPPLTALDLQPPALDVLSAPVVGAVVGGTLGVAALAGAPLVLLTSVVEVPQALAVAGLLSLGGAGIAVGVAAAVFGVGLLVTAAAGPGHVASDGSCVGDLASLLGDALNTCVTVLAAAVGVVLVGAAVMLVAGGVIAVYFAPAVDRAGGESFPENNPFWPALIGAGAGGGAGVIGATLFLLGDRDELSEDQRSLDDNASEIAAGLLVFGAAGLGGSIGYRLGEGRRAIP